MLLFPKNFIQLSFRIKNGFLLLNDFLRLVKKINLVVDQLQVGKYFQCLTPSRNVN